MSWSRTTGAELLTGLAALVLLAACGGGSDIRGSGTEPPPDPCPPTCPGTAPPAPTPTGAVPVEGSAAYDALVVGPEPGELARGGNDADPAVAGQRFEVVVPAGQRLRSRTVCQGRTAVTVTTDPPSGAESELTCREDAPTEVIVEEPDGLPADTTYAVTVTAPAPARWYAVLSAVPAG